MHLLLLLVVTVYCSAQIDICPNRRYTLRAPANQLCYLHYQIAEDFSASNRSCVRDGANLLSIDDSEEDSYVNQTFFLSQNGMEFWIGLNDLDNEGNFRWLNGSVGLVPSYLNWGGGFPSGNTNALDCVKYSTDGWRVHSGYCSTARLPHICKMRSCSSLNGVDCIGAEPTASSSSVDPIVIVVPVILVCVIVAIVVIILVLLALWKFNNDVFQRYCCCCLSRGSKSAVHSMQQENQRLRHELSQHKVSVSGRFQSGQFADERELSGVPDGKGGVLPTIKQAPTTTMSNFSPTGTENRILGFQGDAPPPLVVQRPYQLNRQPSQTSGSFYFGSPDRPTRQSLPGSSFGASNRGTINRGDFPVLRPSIAAPIRGGGGAHTKSESNDKLESSGSESESSGDEETNK